MTEIFLIPPETTVSIVPALIGGIAALGGAVIGGIASSSASRNNRRAVQESNRANLELARYQNEWNIEQWKRENAYNHPIEQMRRLKEAGLNPNLAYGNGSVDNVSASSPTASPMKVEPYLGHSSDMQSMVANILTGLQAFESFKQTQLQTELGKTQVDYLKADVLNKRVQTEKAFEEKMGLQYDNYVKKELREYNIDMFKLQMDDARANIALKHAQTDVHRLSLSYTNKQIAFIGAQLQKVIQESKNLKTTNEYTRQLWEREKLDNILRRQGINPNDPVLYRMLGKALENPDYAMQLIDNANKLGSKIFDKAKKSGPLQTLSELAGQFSPTRALFNLFD